VPDVVDVILRDGSTLRLSPPTADDVDELVAFFARLSPDSRFQRFHGFAAADEALVRTLVDPDWVEHGALVGRLAVDGADRVVAVGNFVRLRESTAAEVAFVVHDELQRRGVGTRLLEQLAARAAAVGIARFVAVVRPENAGMLHVLEHIGFTVERRLDGGVVEATFPIEATERYTATVDERDHVAVVASLRGFFEPGSVAVVGASARPGAIGGSLFRNVLRGDFTGAAYPVNRDAVPVAGVRAYASVAELPEPPDLAVIAVGSDHVLAAAADCLAAGTRALCVISAGFAEVGEEGRRRQDELLALVRSHGARLIGPNCLGISSAAVRLNATFAPHAFPEGRIGLSSQSGALGLALLGRAADHDLGFSSFVSIGNKADISTNDLLEWWESDERTDLAVLYVESFGNPRRFGRIARRVARSKPILAMKAGRSAIGQRAAGSHTAALAGSDRAADALFRQAGVIRATTLEELLDVAGLLASQPLPAGPRVTVLTNAGGLGILCADACAEAGLELPSPSEATVGALREWLPGAASVSNPVDMLGSATGPDFGRAVEVLLGDEGSDALIVLFVPTADLSAATVADAVAEAVRVSPAHKPVLACILAEGGVPAELAQVAATFAFPESAPRALARAVERSAWLRRPVGAVRRPDGIDQDAARALVASVTTPRWLDPAETRALLELYGMPLVAQREAADPDEAVLAAAELGWPAVVKTAAPGAHKTESHGIALDLTSAEAVREAALRIGGPVVVQEMITGASAELLAGLVQDPVFGPLVAFGPGGVLAELIGEAEVRLAPLTDVDIGELVEDGKAGALVRGYRGAPPVDRAALDDLLMRLSALADDLPQVVELDLNPVIGLADRVVVVDARVRVAPPETGSRVKGW
jgi:acetyl coenzyme A synthetase (ADP forming)-like protein